MSQSQAELPISTVRDRRHNNPSRDLVCAPELLHGRGADSVWSLFEGAIRSSDRLVGSPSRQCVEQFHEARLVRITRGALAIWLDPFGMLDPEVVVNLLLELGVGVDLVRYRPFLGQRFKGGAGRLV